ncbi:TPM domain-containing protein [Flavobacterium sp. GSP27]|uniref:TPM domain-containing protein n=1 Tax=Flavobacterium bomense TaxID=2497483 RepID=A0A432CJU6_9FLAO|nr:MULTISPECIES: TPM domain-containing protein [Flavobacterium]RTY90560.1 TPM domain-containing protein [Flavobacterium sp. GSN2]RTY68905.1 TPM domain-containing protein [Flavobacterium sp. LB2P53]RTY73781.1 TPM domain-containing protein [Flavobacterium sp. LS1R10]RTY80571.1 TPM domain-containing protein [Flavobacterium sp. LS1P28]RTY83899.1 TPM domain-containing protein [Flavobacterium sp. ZB4P23]
MSKVAELLTPENEQEIVEAIRMAEKNTSGEIRVHIEKTTSMDAYERARDVFHELKMDETELKNGVLIYLAVDDHQFVICGDQGINDVVQDDFWNCTRDLMVVQFKTGNFKQGLIDGITRAGEQLQSYFPWQEGDTNELSNEISKG